MDINKAEFSGRLVVDAESKVTTNGNPYLYFKLACTTYKYGEERTIYVKVRSYTHLHMKDKLTKGSSVVVWGELTAEGFISKLDGGAKVDLAVDASAITILYSKSTVSAGQQSTAQDQNVAVSLPSNGVNVNAAPVTPPTTVNAPATSGIPRAKSSVVRNVTVEAPSVSVITPSIGEVADEDELPF